MCASVFQNFSFFIKLFKKLTIKTRQVCVFMSVNLPTLTDRNVERSVVVLCAKSSKNVVACVKVVVMSK